MDLRQTPFWNKHPGPPAISPYWLKSCMRLKTHNSELRNDSPWYDPYHEP